MISSESRRLIGYARVSTNEQELCLQMDALFAHGVTKEYLFFDKLSGAPEDRPGLQRATKRSDAETRWFVWRLD